MPSGVHPYLQCALRDSFDQCSCENFLDKEVSVQYSPRGTLDASSCLCFCTISNDEPAAWFSELQQCPISLCANSLKEQLRPLPLSFPKGVADVGSHLKT